MKAQQVRAYWYNMQTDGQSVQLVMGEIRAFSSLHLLISDADTLESARVKVLLNDGSCAYQREFKLGTTTDTLDYTVKRADDGSLHLEARVDTLREDPSEILVELNSQTGTTNHAIPCRYHHLHGQITDFAGRPFKAFIMVSPDSFGDSGIGTWTDEQGNYSLTLPERTYNSIWVDDETYATQTLEAWAWHIIMDQDQKLDFHVGNGEVYGLTAWPSNGGYPVYFLHFRPMALPLLQPPQSAEESTGGAPPQSIRQLNSREYNVTDLAPDLEPEDIKVSINGARAEIISVQEVLETGPDRQAMRSYLVQVSRKGHARAGKQTICLRYRKQVEVQGKTQWAESMGYCQFKLNSAGMPE